MSSPRNEGGDGEQIIFLKTECFDAEGYESFFSGTAGSTAAPSGPGKRPARGENSRPHCPTAAVDQILKPAKREKKDDPRVVNTGAETGHGTSSPWNFFAKVDPTQPGADNIRCIVDVKQPDGNIRPCSWTGIHVPDKGMKGMFVHLEKHPEELAVVRRSSCYSTEATEARAAFSGVQERMEVPRLEESKSLIGHDWQSDNVRNPPEHDSDEGEAMGEDCDLGDGEIRGKSRGGRVRSSHLANINTPSSRKGPQSRARLCGLTICGTGVRRSIGGGGECEDCGDGVAHGIDELLCSACHRTLGSRVIHLGEKRLPLATQWIQECRASNRGLPTTIVDSYKPSTGCLCSRADCFYRHFSVFMKSSTKPRCIPCGARSSRGWRAAGYHCNEYQQFFSGEGGCERTESGMAATKEVITADSAICSRCYSAFKNATKKGWRPTLNGNAASPATFF